MEQFTLSQNHSKIQQKQIFVGRERHIEEFQNKVTNLPSNKSDLIIFLGKGGQGKTALAEELERQLNKKDICSSLDCKVASLNLSVRSYTGIDFLINLRNKLSPIGIDFPIFDIAILAYWTEVFTERSEPNLHKPYYGAIKRTAGQAASEGVSIALSALEVTVPLFGFFAKKGIEFSIDLAKGQYVRSCFEHINLLYSNGKMANVEEIKALLPMLLAYDFNYWLENDSDRDNKRVIIILDEYERLTLNSDSMFSESPSEINEYCRELVRHLKCVLIAIFSRTIPEWGVELQDQLKKVSMTLCGLPLHHAREFVSKNGINDEQLIEVITKSSLEDSKHEEGCFPILLDLQVMRFFELESAGHQVTPDMLTLTSSDFESKLEELIERLMRDVNVSVEKTINRLIHTDSFDKELFIEINNTFQTGLIADDFDGFVKKALIKQNDDGSFEVLHVIAEVIRTNASDVFTRQTKEILFRFHNQRCNPNRYLKYTSQNHYHLLRAAEYKLSIDMHGFYNWLKDKSNTLKNNGYSLHAIELFKKAMECENTNYGLKKQKRFNYLMMIALFRCRLGDLEPANKLELERQKPFNSNEITKFIQFSCGFNKAIEWFTRLKIIDNQQEKRNSNLLYTVNSLLVMAKSQNEIEKCKQLIEQYGLELDEYSVAELIRFKDTFAEALKLIESKENILINSHISTNLLLKATEPSHIRTVLSLMRKNQCNVDIVNYNTIINKPFSNEMNGLIKELSQRLDDVFNVNTYTTLTANCESYSEVRKLYLEMCNRDISMDTQYLSAVIKKSQNVDQVSFWLDEAFKHNIRINQYTVRNLSFHIVDLHSAKVIFSKISSTGNYIAKPLVDRVVRLVVELNDRDGLLALFERMIDIEGMARVHQLRYMIEALKDTGGHPDIAESWYFKSQQVDASFSMNIDAIKYFIKNSSTFNHSTDWLEECKKQELDVSKVYELAAAKATNVQDADKLIKIIEANEHKFDQVIKPLIISIIEKGELGEKVNTWLNSLKNIGITYKQEAWDEFFLTDNYDASTVLFKTLLNNGYQPRIKDFSRIVNLATSFENLISLFHEISDSGIHITQGAINLLFEKASGASHRVLLANLASSLKQKASTK